jgi:hypothetical protein
MVKKGSGLKGKTVNEFRTICEVHREIYDLIEGNKNTKSKEKIISLLEEVYKMGKKMNNKLIQYKFGWDKDFWDKNKNYEEKLDRRKSR